jgi:hypothetical protein
VEFTAISWNLFHGRDFPPDPTLRTWRSRLLRTSERNATHVQVNRDLLPEFSRLLAGAEWDVALLQECPPRYRAPLADACASDAHRALTSRNSFGTLRTLAARLNPDLIASGEGGSNLTLVRGWGGIVERRELTIHAGRPERRTMAFTRTAAEICVANLHATNDRPELAAEDVRRAATAATKWRGMRRCSSAATSTCAQRRAPRSLSSWRSASASPRRPPRTRSTICWRGDWMWSRLRIAGPPSGASWTKTAAPFASPTTPLWRRASQPHHSSAIVRRVESAFTFGRRG